jgi:Zn-dependent metalloprotease
MTSLFFRNVHWSAGEELPPNVQPRLRTLGRTAATIAAVNRLSKRSDESASRFFLQTYFQDQEDLALKAQVPELIPDMQLSNISREGSLRSNRVVYQQTSDAVPIFGAVVSVDVDSVDKTLVAINGKVTPRPDANPIATISAADALSRLIAWGRADEKAEEIRKAVTPPVLTWFLDQENSRWHLVHRFVSFPMTPTPEVGQGISEVAHVCIGCSSRPLAELYDYFVDAHDGSVVFYFSSTPHLDVPAEMLGIDCLGTDCKFFGMQESGYFVLTDPVRNIETYDYQNNDACAEPQPPLPPSPIRNQTNDFGNTFPGAVSAHHNAQLVYDFYNDVLKRHGLDDKGMKLVSVVNVYCSSKTNPLPPPQWKNAVFSDSMMWYGQVNGVSLAKYLDVIAHELTHGVTFSSSNLIMRDVSGALNESYSDIFGVIIANWYTVGPKSLAKWNWEIGSGLADNGGPLRDFANPARTNQPDHWSQYKPLPEEKDRGGVHIYSGIHNKAIYHLLTGIDANDLPTFPIGEAALLLYLTLTRLTPTSDFNDNRRTLENVTRTYHAGNPATMAVRLAAIETAYQSVGL